MSFERYFKSRYDTLKDCGFVIYEWSPSRNNRLKLLLYHKKGAIVSPKPPLFTKQESKDLKEIIARLNERLDEPFVTAGTVTGDKGIKTCASRMQTSSLDLLRRRQVYPSRRRTSTSAS